VARPEDARLDPALEPTLERLRAATGSVVVISGRDRKFLEERVKGLLTVGSYGLEMPETMSRSGLPDGFPVAAVRGRLELARQEMEATPSTGARLEVKPWGLALHYRGAGPGFDEARVMRLAEEVADRHGLVVHEGRLVLELKPREAVDKGRALSLVAAHVQPSAVVFVGDDLGDVPAWETTHRLGERIPSLAVGIGSPELPGAALASCDLVLGDRGQLGRFLEELAMAAESGASGPTPY